jgi:hypothetical protein
MQPFRDAIDAAQAACGLQGDVAAWLLRVTAPVEAASAAAAYAADVWELIVQKREHAKLTAAWLLRAAATAPAKAAPAAAEDDAAVWDPIWDPTPELAPPQKELSLHDAQQLEPAKLAGCRMLLWSCCRVLWSVMMVVL